MKRTLSVILTAFVIVASFIPAYATNVNIDGRNVLFDKSYGEPFVDQSGRIQVPLRQTMEAFGSTVIWNEETKTVIIEKDGTKVEVPIGQMYIVKDGQRISNDTAAVIKDSRVYLPIRSVLEAFGASVSWDDPSKTVKVSTGAEQESIQTISPTPTQNSNVTQSEAAYIGNSNTMKFHRLDCRYVDQIKDVHVIYLKTRDNAISGGYVPCKVCNP